ncbi:MAG TPA: serine/threonine-protein kinase [Polyangiaceae bacterium]|nr:serine/threonine-protein kinase [Polyangiaceae bacterium]
MTEYLTVLDRLGIDPQTLSLDEGGTLVRDGTRRPRIDGLPQLRIERTTQDPQAELRLGMAIGSGGMGVVREALQLPLQRRVAVKQSAQDSPEADGLIVQEARVTGALEHPNIVPVHQLGRDADGSATLVMKYIEGQLWSAQLTPLFPREAVMQMSLGGARDVIGQHLRTFMQLCNAVHFAHSRGVVHRDIKPENVMIGAFGELYLLDWGLAVGTKECAIAGLRPARDVRDIEGTPSYLAPEMAACDGSRIDPRTDVYLLGATLHRVISGTAPHASVQVVESLSRAFVSAPPRFEPHVPRELADICRRAMAREPEDRYVSAAELREAVDEFLGHRASTQASTEALRLVEAFEAALFNERAGDHQGLRQLAGEARYGFRQALRTWEGNREARAGLQRLLERLIEFELERGNVDAAQSLLPELPEQRADLAERVAHHHALQEEREKRFTALERFWLDADFDVDAGARTRGTALIATSIVVPVLVLVALRISGLHRAGYLDALLVTAAPALAASWNAVRMRTNLASARSRYVTGVVTSAIAVHFALAWALGVELDAALATALLIAAAVAATHAVLVSRMLILSTVPLIAGAVGIALWPRARGAFAILGFGGAFAIVALVWNERRKMLQRLRGRD